MGLFDFLRKSEPNKYTKTQNPTTSTLKESVSKFETKKNGVLKALNQDEIKKNILLKSASDDIKIELYCTVYPARIYCHSVLVDKLGDLTKFIISSLYAGHSVEEISGLTQMGAITIKEEIEYLIRGGLVNTDKESLTELGLQYGRLIEIFDELSEGIGVAFNTFANLFEPIEENGYYPEAEQKYILPNHFIPTLARNDNYANSLNIAIEQIEEDAPFGQEMKKSLYATVKIEKSKHGYKRMVINNLGKGLRDKKEQEACIKVAIPCDHILYKPRYSWIDPYRDAISIIRKLNETHDDLLSDEAKLIINASKEEEAADPITIDIDTLAGGLINRWDKLEELPKDESIIILDRQETTISFNSDACEGIYLEEIGREELYKFRYFPYSRMEVC